jgi:hypothetical protein
MVVYVQSDLPDFDRMFGPRLDRMAELMADTSMEGNR